MLMVVFGAGASYDSAPDHWPPTAPSFEDAIRPPLADQLFDTRPIYVEALQSFPECLSIVTRLRQRPAGATVEAVLDELQGESTTDPIRGKQLAAVRWYLHYMLSSCVREWDRYAGRVTNYRTIVDEIRYAQGGAGQTIFVTFNYDLLLDDAMSIVDVDTSSLAGYISNDAYRLIKLHGSVNWAHPVETVLPQPTSWGFPDFQKPNMLIDLAPTLELSANFRIVHTYPMGWEAGGNGWYAFPAIAIPLLKKDRFECPTKHVASLRDALPKLTHLLIIGWRAAEYKFLEMIRTAISVKPKVLVVSGSEKDAREVITILRDAEIAGERTEFSTLGFTAFVKARNIYEFLRS